MALATAGTGMAGRYTRYSTVQYSTVQMVALIDWSVELLLGTGARYGNVINKFSKLSIDWSSIRGMGGRVSHFSQKCTILFVNPGSRIYICKIMGFPVTY